MNKRGVLPTLLAAALCSALAAAPAQATLKVVASFSIIGDMARAVGQDRITLRTLVGPNGDAHVYEPSPADAIATANAEVILINGLKLEGFITRLIQASESRATVVETSKGAAILKDPAGGHYHFNSGQAVFHAAPLDPHAWQSVANARVYVKNIADAFCAADSSGCDHYRRNASAYDRQLSALDAQIRATVARVPEERRTVVVGHHAFRYFGETYGIHFLSPQGVSTESEASAADVAGILRQIKARRASAVFAENISNPRLVQQIAAGAGMKVAGTLYSDALSAADGPAATYIAMMTHNAATIAAAAGAPR